MLTSPTSIGRARELIVNEFLGPHLPQRLHVVRGEMIDSDGRSSGELDTILRDDQSLAWGVGGEQLLPVEAATGFVEIKSGLAGDNLADAIRKVAAAKQLVRRPHVGFYVPTDDARVEVPPRRARGYVVAFGGPGWKTIASNIMDNTAWYEGDYLAHGPEAIVILGQGALVKRDNEIISGEGHDLGVVLEDRPGLEVMSLHINETVRRYGALTYDLTTYFQ